MYFSRMGRFKRCWWVNTLLLGFALFYAGYTAVVELNHDQRIHNLALSGWKTEGVITRKFTTSAQPRSRIVYSYYYRYAFLANKNKITATHTILGSYNYDQDNIGQPVTVLYDHNNPLDCTIYPPGDIGDCSKFITIARIAEVIGIIMMVGTVAIKLIFRRPGSLYPDHNVDGTV